jgi:hypothetical protein
MHGSFCLLSSDTSSRSKRLELSPCIDNMIRKEPTDTDVEVAERSLARIQEDLADRQASMHKQDAAKVLLIPNHDTRLVDNQPSIGTLHLQHVVF